MGVIIRMDTSFKAEMRAFCRTMRNNPKNLVGMFLWLVAFELRMSFVD